MANDSYLKALIDAQEELQTLFVERAALDSKIAKLRQTIGSLAQLCQPLPPEIGIKILDKNMGLTEAVREVLRASDKFLTPYEIRDGLDRLGYSTGNHANIIASIYTTIRRMGENQEVVENEFAGKKSYRLYQPLSAEEEAERLAKQTEIDKHIEKAARRIRAERRTKAKSK